MADQVGLNMETFDAKQALEGQASHVEGLGAACTARIIRSFEMLMDGNTRCGMRMRDWPGLLLEDAVPLRLAGGFHYLHLTGRDERLSAVYSGRVSEQADVDEIIAAVAADHDAFLVDWFDSPPQTNEAGRSACIMAGLLWLAGRIAPRFELNEIGASAGVNTMMCRFGFDLGRTRTGIRSSPMQIVPDWRGPPPPGNPVEIIGSRGCDILPIDLTDPTQADRLKSYVWPDVPERIARIETAIALAKEYAPQVDSADAGEWLAGRLLAEQPSGVTRLLCHSIVWQYLPAETRARIERDMEAAGARATSDRPLAWVRFETNRETFRHEISARYWPGGEGWTLLGHAHAHGTWIEWFGD